MFYRIKRMSRYIILFFKNYPRIAGASCVFPEIITERDGLTSLGTDK